MTINNCNFLVSYDVSSLFTNIPSEETIQLLADKAFKNSWFNKTRHLNLNTLSISLERQPRTNFSRSTASFMNRPTELLWASFRLGPLLTNVLICSTKETLERERKMPTYDKRFVDHTLTNMPDRAQATHVKTKVKPTNTGLLRHYKSHVDA